LTVITVPSYHYLTDEGDFLPPLNDVLESDGVFGHRQHVQLAWRYLYGAEPEIAERSMKAAIRHVATTHGAPEKYHETLTIAWVRLVAAHIRSCDAGSFDEFIAANPGLLDRRLPERHYSRATLWTGHARHEWVEPDLLPLP
jgi:hypothetical protein